MYVPRCAWMIGVSLCLGLSGAPLDAAWPTYRGDAHRSGVSTEPLELPLKEAWLHRPPRVPSPAWPELPAKRDVFRRVAPLGPTTAYDRAFHAVIGGGAVLFGSSTDDAVYCLDAADGAVRWSFTTEGPVRLAPTLADGRVYVGSDDGCVYCLAERDGKLLWKHRGGPSDRRLPGNGRMISLWPIRCGVVIDQGIVYFCAGLFPDQGNYLCAVSAADGKELWTQPIEAATQGYMLASPAHLYAPTGRTTPQVFDRQTGKSLGALPGGGPNAVAGGCFSLLVDDTIAYSAGETPGLHFGAPGSKEKLVFTDGLAAVAAGPMAYILTKDKLYALDRAHFLELSRLQAKKTKTAEETARIEALGGSRKAYIRWETPCPDGCELILAGGKIFVGELDRVTAYAPSDGKQLWRAAVLGRAHGLAASDGRLYVSTDKGAVHCFQTGKPAPGGPHRFEFLEAAVLASPYPTDAKTPLYAQAVDALLRRAGATKGYCLTLGAGTGRLAYEIARRSEFQVIDVEPDAARADRARRQLIRAGVYGARVSVHLADFDRLPYQGLWANLIVSEEALLTGKLPAAPEELLRVLRPCGGCLALVVQDGPAPDALRDWGGRALPGWKVEQCSLGLIGSLERGPLPGAGEWSHFYADPGNTACSGDGMKPGAVDLQWFGLPGPRDMPDRHDKNVGPLFKQGRLFVSGDNCLVAVDAYNGAILWRRDVPQSVRLGAFKHCGNMAAAADRLYVASGGECLALDAQSGKLARTFHVPEGPDAVQYEWGYVALNDDLLVGSATRLGGAFREQTIETEVLIWRDRMPVVCSDALFGDERASGRRLWTYRPARGVIINPTLTLGGGRAYFVESTNPETRQVADGRIKLPMLLSRGADLVALDLRSGQPVWRQPAGLEAVEHIVFLSYTRDKLLMTGTRNVQEGKSKRVRYDLAAFSASSGRTIWRATHTPNPDQILEGPHGEQVQHPAIVGDAVYCSGFTCDLNTGRLLPGWKWVKSGNCGILTASAVCAFSRFSNARMFDLASGEHTVLSTATRPGCWVNILPAGGLILMPEASAGCTCGYAIQTSIALAPRSP